MGTMTYGTEMLLDSSLCIKCLFFFLTLACTLEDSVYQTACRKSSSNIKKALGYNIFANRGT